MPKTFEEALEKIIEEYWGKATFEEMISALELQKMALEEAEAQS